MTDVAAITGIQSDTYMPHTRPHPVGKRHPEFRLGRLYRWTSPLLLNRRSRPLTDRRDGPSQNPAGPGRGPRGPDRARQQLNRAKSGPVSNRVFWSRPTRRGRCAPGGNRVRVEDRLQLLSSSNAAAVWARPDAAAGVAGPIRPPAQWPSFTHPKRGVNRSRRRKRVTMIIPEARAGTKAQCSGASDHVGLDGDRAPG